VFILVSYDVCTVDKEGRKRLRKVAEACQSYGQRVQDSVFECLVEPAQWVHLRQRLIDRADLEQDSLRFYFLGSNWRRRIEHLGVKPSIDPEAPLIV